MHIRIDSLRHLSIFGQVVLKCEFPSGINKVYSLTDSFIQILEPGCPGSNGPVVPAIGQQVKQLVDGICAISDDFHSQP